MQKVLAFLEKNVQWVAIALGALYLAWNVYSYVLHSPSKVAVGDAMLSPGQVDEHIKKDFAEPLADAMSGSKMPAFPAPPDAPRILSALTQPLTVAETAQVPWDSKASDAPLPNPGSTPTVIDPRKGTKLTKMKAMPNLSAATDVQVVSGRSNAEVPAAGAVAAAPAQPNPNNAPAGGNADPAAAAAAQPVAGTDISWATVKFKISHQALADEFKRCEIPDSMTTEFLRVELIRQELSSDMKTWGGDKTIPFLTTANIEPYPDGKNKALVGQYVNWAESHQIDLLQPGFYTVVRGDTWRLPGEEGGQIAGAGGPSAYGPNDVRPGFDPANPPADPTNREKQMIYKYQQEKKREEQKAKPKNPGGAPSGSKGGRGGPSGGGPSMGPGDNQTPNRQPRGGNGGAGRNEGGQGGVAGGDDVGVPPEFRSGGGPQPQYPGQPMPGMPMPGQQPDKVKTLYPMPQGPFDPRAFSDDIIGWAHDTTVQPGKTYRYTVRYKMKNPGYGLPGAVEDKKLADNFDIVSPMSAPTEQITIPNPTSFFLAGVNLNANNARFEVYHWQNGELQVKTYTVAPGDMIGKDEAGVNFATGFTVVDVLKTGVESGVLIVDADGNLKKREQVSDQRDPELGKLKTQVSAASSSNSAVAGTR